MLKKKKVSFLRSIITATGGDTKMESHSSPLPREVNASTDNVLRAAVAPGMTTALELRNPPSVNAAKTSPTTIPQSGVVLPSEAWLQVMYAVEKFSNHLLYLS